MPTCSCQSGSSGSEWPSSRSRMRAVLVFSLGRYLAGRSRVVDLAHEVVERGVERFGDHDRGRERCSRFSELDHRDLAARGFRQLREPGLGQTQPFPLRSDTVADDPHAIRGLIFEWHWIYPCFSTGRERAGLMPWSSGAHAVGKSGRAPFWEPRHPLRWTPRPARIRFPALGRRSLSQWSRAASSARGRCKVVPLSVDRPSTPVLFQATARRAWSRSTRAW